MNISNQWTPAERLFLIHMISIALEKSANPGHTLIKLTISSGSEKIQCLASKPKEFLEENRGFLLAGLDEVVGRLPAAVTAPDNVREAYTF